MKSPRYTAGVVSVYRKYVDRYLAMGRKGYEVDPKDRRMLWIFLTGVDLQRDIIPSITDGI